MKHFEKEEFACPCCGENNISLALMHRLELARGIAGVPFKINSGYRCVDHNIHVGGAVSSSHLIGAAADIACTTGAARHKILTALLEAGFDRIGVADTFIHVDIDETKPQRVIWTY